MARYRALTRRLLGVVTAIEEVLPREPLRQWAVIECSITSAVRLSVTIFHKADSTIYLTTELQPGEKVVFSRWGDMPWDGVIALAGVGGTATYRGGEVYWERT